MKLYNKHSHIVLAENVVFAHGFISRAVGLLGQTSWPMETCLWLKPCNNIHTFFMRFALDVIFVDEKLFVVAKEENLQPWALRWHRRAYSTFEFQTQSGRLSTVEVGDELYVGD